MNNKYSPQELLNVYWKIRDGIPVEEFFNSPAHSKTQEMWVAGPFRLATDRAVAAMDTKYKRHKRPEESDIQQVIAYAVRMDVDIAFLLCGGNVDKVFAIRHKHDMKPGEVHSQFAELRNLS